MVDGLPAANESLLPRLALNMPLPRIALLADLVDVQALPLRLREDFAYRPWPTHPLWKKIVDPPYFRKEPLDESREGWALEIITDNHIAIDGCRRKISGYALELFNLMLLTRDWALRCDEYATLGFGASLGHKSRLQRLKSGRERLGDKVAPYEIFANPHLGSTEPQRMYPALRINDWRLISKL